jgi:hypothetical protein
MMPEYYIYMTTENRADEVLVGSFRCMKAFTPDEMDDFNMRDMAETAAGLRAVFPGLVSLRVEEKMDKEKALLELLRREAGITDEEWKAVEEVNAVMKEMSQSKDKKIPEGFKEKFLAASKVTMRLEQRRLERIGVKADIETIKAVACVITYTEASPSLQAVIILSVFADVSPKELLKNIEDDMKAMDEVIGKDIPGSAS